MTTTSRTMPETSIAALAKQALIARHDEFCPGVELSWRTELPLVLPEHGGVSADLVYCAAMPEGDCFGVVEAKYKCNNEVVAQAMRWLGHAHYIYVAYIQPVSMRDAMRARMNLLDRAGIGRIAIIGEVAEIVQGAVYQECDARLIAEAFAQHDGSADAASGSASAHRMNGDRALLCRIAEVVGAGMMFKEMPHDIQCAAKSPYRLRQLIDANRDWPKLPMDFDGHAQTTFYRTNNGEKA